jgi:hypothetical protein
MGFIVGISQNDLGLGGVLKALATKEASDRYCSADSSGVQSKAATKNSLRLFMPGP